MRLLATALLLTTLQNILHKFIFIYTSYYAGLYLWVKRRWFYIFIVVQLKTFFQYSQHKCLTVQFYLFENGKRNWCFQLEYFNRETCSGTPLLILTNQSVCPITMNPKPFLVVCGFKRMDVAKTPLGFRRRESRSKKYKSASPYACLNLLQHQPMIVRCWIH